MGLKREKQIVFFDLQKTLGLELVFGQKVCHSFSRHTHQNLCIGLIETGNRMFICRGNQYKLEAGDVFLVPPMEMHACSSEDGHSYKLMLLSRELLETILPLPAENIYEYRTLVFSDPNLSERFTRLCRLLVARNSTFTKQAAINTTVGDLLEKSMEIATSLQLETDEAVRKVKNYLDVNYQETLPLEELAAKAYLSHWHFLRLFSKMTGLPPHLYQQQLRIREAKKLLVSGVSLNETALITGFADQSHFTHVFKNFMGITPKAYCQGRREVSESEDEFSNL